MNILLLEDEKAAATRLISLVKEVEPTALILDVLETVRDTLKWLKNNEPPDLILSDITLADGLSLDIFSQVEINVPVIFTTAYDAYTLKAFKLNSIDYLLKPIDKDELKAAFAKYHSLHGEQDVNKKLVDLFKSMASGKPAYKSRFLIKQGERFIIIPTDEVAYIRADDKVVFLYTQKGAKYIIEESVDELETLLNPDLFFRLNRTYMAPLTSIEKITNHFNGRLKISIANNNDDEIYVSRARASDFKKWLGK